MSHRDDGRFVSRPPPRLAAGALALGVHVLFVLLLVFGVSWQTEHPAPVMVDLWEAVPAPPPAARPRPPEPAPVPRKPAPPPRPEAEEPPPPKAPDIALEKKRAEAERLKKAQTAEEKLRAEAARVAQEKQAAERKRRELLRQMEEEDVMQRMADEEAATQARVVKQAEARSAASARQSELSRVVGQYRDLISAKVRGNTRLPEDLRGNPEVRCAVRLLPTGEVAGVTVTRSSGNPAYDDAVVRAIHKSSPLPLPTEREARAQFVPELSFVHRPKE